MDFDQEEQQELRLRSGDLLVCEGGEVGRAAIWQGQFEECYFQKALHRIRPHPSVCCPEYLYLQFVRMSLNGGFSEHTSHSTIAHLTGVKLKSIPIPLPPLDEQWRIVDLLERAAGIRRLREQALTKARAIVPALFLDMFGDVATNPKGWPIVSLGETLLLAQYGTSKKASDTPCGLPVLRMGNVNYGGDLDLNDVKYVDLDAAEAADLLLREGDLLFNRTNSKEMVGKTGLWNVQFPAVAASYFIRLRVDERQAVPEFVWSFMNSAFMKRRLFETARGAIGQANINTKELRAFPLLLPPVERQRSFAERLADLRSIIAQQERSLAGARELERSLMARLLG